MTHLLLYRLARKGDEALAEMSTLPFIPKAACHTLYARMRDLLPEWHHERITCPTCHTDAIHLHRMQVSIAKAEGLRYPR